MLSLLIVAGLALLILAGAVRLAGMGCYRGAHRRYEPRTDPAPPVVRPSRVPPAGHVRDPRYNSRPVQAQ